MSRLNRSLGMLRSLAIYHDAPWRAARLRHFYEQYVPPGGLAFDVGAHLGNRVRAWRRLGARVVAVEPQPDFAKLLHGLFDNDNQVTVLAQALGREPGEAQLLTSERTPTVTTLSADWARRTGAILSFRNMEWRPGPMVPVTTLDALIAQFGRPDFVKIDVEGFELDVLHGLSQPLPALCFEYLAPVRDLAEACVDRLESLGHYRYFASTGDRLRSPHPDGLSASEMKQWLATLAPDAGSGDIHARLVNRGAVNRFS